MLDKQRQQETRRPWSGAQSGSRIYQPKLRHIFLHYAHFITLDAESKFAEIQSSNFRGEGGGMFVEM